MVVILSIEACKFKAIMNSFFIVTVSQKAEIVVLLVRVITQLGLILFVDKSIQVLPQFYLILRLKFYLTIPTQKHAAV